MSVQVFYILQNEPGEDLSHPNVFRLPPDTPGLEAKRVKLRYILEHFPLRGTGNFHFRFKLGVNQPANSFNWVDITDPEAFVPFYKGMLLAKALRLDRPFYSGKVRGAHDWSYGATESKGTRSRHTKNRKTKSSTRPVQTSKTSGNSGKQQAASATPVTSPKEKRAQVKRKTAKPQTEDENMIQFEEFQEAQSSSTINLAEPEMMEFDTLHQVQKTNHVAIKNKIRDDMSDEVKVKIAARQAEEQKRIDDAAEEHLRRLEEEKQNQVDRDRVKSELQGKLLEWSGDINQGTLKNIRALLTTMHTVLWEGCEYKPVTMADVVQSSKIKIKYYKAIRLVHPDRSQKAPPEQKYISEAIFEALNAAWDKFVLTEGR